MGGRRQQRELSPTGPPPELFVDGEPPQVEFPDPLTVRYSWSKPNPFFLPALAGATPIFIYMPAHYLKQFHENYADPDELPAKVQEAQARDWAQLHGRKDGMYIRQPGPADLAALASDHAAAGRRGSCSSATNTSTGSTRPASSCPTSTGWCSTWSTTSWSRSRPAPRDRSPVRGLFFKHYTFLKESEARSHLDTYLWETARARTSPSIPISTPMTRSGASCSATCASAARCRSPSTATRSTRSCTSASRLAAAIPSCPRARCTSRSIATPGRSSIWSRPTRCSTRSV